MGNKKCVKWGFGTGTQNGVHIRTPHKIWRRQVQFEELEHIIIPRDERSMVVFTLFDFRGGDLHAFWLTLFWAFVPYEQLNCCKVIVCLLRLAELSNARNDPLTKGYILARPQPIQKLMYWERRGRDRRKFGPIQVIISNKHIEIGQLGPLFCNFQEMYECIFLRFLNGQRIQCSFRFFMEPIFNMSIFHSTLLYLRVCPSSW